MRPGSSRLMPWADFLAGRWTDGYTDAPCRDGVAAAMRAFPGWPKGRPPTWAQLCRAALADKSGNGWSFARWLIARVLLIDRSLLVEWVRVSTFVRLDATEEWTAKRMEGSEFADDIAGIRGDLYAWSDGATIDLVAVRDAAWEIRSAAADADADAAAAYAADAAAYAAADADAADADADDARREILDGALPLLDRAMARRSA